ncbi:uncharacterized protein F5Z01DRAFT_638087 [Emericellopsis atlantica]|uniref:Uncharacterized protein n=1 Tax=Emericellopsis atlantica TaxID=2614577 RepID=A0A9P8CMC8_9HYPO|nr:uncharacterized protein F5Z01DRAFT_638087 [Emericellopsis atlantica]KAG9252584.1 hypothetical protein F5Z01DRAFT_638087 [Emericellopsis atlantica]
MKIDQTSLTALSKLAVPDCSSYFSVYTRYSDCISLPPHHHNMPSKPEEDSVSPRSPDRVEESLTSSRIAPEMQHAENSGRYTSELHGGYKYDWNDPELVQKLHLDIEGQLQRNGQNSTERQSSNDSGTGNMDFLSPLDPDQLRSLGFLSSGPGAATESAVQQAEVTGTNVAIPSQRSTVRALPSHAAGGSSSWSQPGYEKLTSINDLSGGPALAWNNIGEEPRQSPPPPPPTADDGTQANMSTPLDIEKLFCSKTLGPDSGK